MWKQHSPSRDSLSLRPEDEEKGASLDGSYLTLHDSNDLSIEEGSSKSRRFVKKPLLLLLIVFFALAIFSGFRMGAEEQGGSPALEVSPSTDTARAAGKSRDGEAPTLEEEKLPLASEEEQVVIQITSIILPDSCVDGRQNQDELGVDCGGICTAICGQQVLIQPTFQALADNLVPNYAGALEGGPTGKADDAFINNFYTQAQVEAFLPGLFNAPTDGPPSPRFGVTGFDAKYLRCEEFGQKPLQSTDPNTPLAEQNVDPLPTPSGLADYSPIDGWLLRKTTSIALDPYPREFSNTKLSSPWLDQISLYLGRTVSTPLEGRPHSFNWKHQRFNEFFPAEFIETVTTGARTNRGERNHLQKHNYQLGEFGVGGLYNQVVPGFGPNQGTNGLPFKFHPTWPTQNPNSCWTFDGTVPPKIGMFRYGVPVLFRHHNGLPIDVTSNAGFGIHAMTTHEHNGHNPAESDGYAAAFFLPSQFYDNRYPMVVAGHDTINVNAADPKMSTPLDNGGIQNIPGDFREIMSTHWIHDHMIDFTAQNSYKGMAGAINYYSGIDRGAEHIDDGVNLRLPSGQSLGWGNRDYDVDMVLTDKAFDPSGQLWMNPFNVGGFLGDIMTVNFLYKPTLEVRPRRYRFRILDASVSRLMQICLTRKAPTGEYVGYPFHMIANDGNIMEHAVFFPTGCLPEQGIAERYDIVVDFARLTTGDELFFVNVGEHLTGIKLNRLVPLSTLHLYDNSIGPVVVQQAIPGVQPEIIADRYRGDPCVGEFTRVVVAPPKPGQVDLSMDPSEYVAETAPGVAGKKMIPIRRVTRADLQNAVYHDFAWKKQQGGGNAFPARPWRVSTDGQGPETADMRRLSIGVEKDSERLQIWALHSNGGWSHPIHAHFEEAVLISTDGARPPDYQFYARKDVFKMGAGVASNRDALLALRFREFSGTYVMHCHNTQHEDWAMLLRWDVENPGEVFIMPNVFPTWDGVVFPVVENSVLGLFRSGLTANELGKVTTVTTGTDPQPAGGIDDNPNVDVPAHQAAAAIPNPDTETDIDASLPDFRTPERLVNRVKRLDDLNSTRR